MSGQMRRGSGAQSRLFRDAFGRFATGVAVATCAPEEDAPLGVTINALASLSLDPPLALFCLERTSASLEAFLRAGRFALNILCDDQQDLSGRFAKNHMMSWDEAERWTTGAPILRGALASADCLIADTVPGGDHLIIIGAVQEVGFRENAEPLLYFGGGYRGLAPKSQA